MATREERERVRLLYVGFTRARDHLVLAARHNGKAYATDWLDELSTERGDPLVRLPPPDAPSGGVIELSGRKGPPLRAQVRAWTLAGDAPPVADPSVEEARIFARPTEPAAERRAYWIAPSRAEHEWPEASSEGASVGQAEPIGEALPLRTASSVSWDVVGTTVHGFLAADVPGLPDKERLARAERLLTASNLSALLEPISLLTASDRLRAWAEGRWPGAVWRREVAVTGVVGAPGGVRGVSGTIDLLLETKAGVILIDHKSFPGSGAALAAKAASFAPQLAAYARLLEAAGHRVLSRWVHFPLAGRVVSVQAASGDVA